MLFSCFYVFIERREGAIEYFASGSQNCLGGPDCIFILGFFEQAATKKIIQRSDNIGNS